MTGRPAIPPRRLSPGADCRWLAGRVAAWLAAARAGLDPGRQRHFLATLGPDLVRAFQAEEEDLSWLGGPRLLLQREAHRDLVRMLAALQRRRASGGDIGPGIVALLGAWLRHHRLPAQGASGGVRQDVAGQGA